MQQQTEIAAPHRTPVEVAEGGDADRVRQGEHQQDGVEPQDPEELAEDHLRLGDRHGDQKLDGAGAFLLGEKAHRQRRKREDEDETEPAKHLPGAGAAEEEKRLPEEEAQRQHDDGDDDVCDRPVEVASELAAADGEDVTHDDAPPLPVVSCRKMSSRFSPRCSRPRSTRLADTAA